MQKMLSKKGQGFPGLSWLLIIGGTVVGGFLSIAIGVILMAAFQNTSIVACNTNANNVFTQFFAFTTNMLSNAGTWGTIVGITILVGIFAAIGVGGFMAYGAIKGRR